MTGLNQLDRIYHTPGHHDREWMTRAACRGHDTNIWFPDRNGRPTKKQHGQARQAQQICQDCPVQPDCLRHALVTDTRHGIWGGATETDRAKLTGRRAYG